MTFPAKRGKYPWLFGRQEYILINPSNIGVSVAIFFQNASTVWTDLQIWPASSVDGKNPKTTGALNAAPAFRLAISFVTGKERGINP